MSEYVNKYREQLLAMRRYIESTPEIWAVATETALNCMLSGVAFEDHNAWQTLEIVADNVACAIPLEVYQSIAPSFDNHYELVACVFEDMADELRN